MKIILSPAKKMIVDTDNLAPLELPVYIDKTAEVLNWMKSKSKEEQPLTMEEEMSREAKELRLQHLSQL